jgi:hypothetical protein
MFCTKGEQMKNPLANAASFNVFGGGGGGGAREVGYKDRTEYCLCA